MREWQFCVTVPVRGQIRTYESVTVRKGQFGKKRKNILSKKYDKWFWIAFPRVRDRQESRGPDWSTNKRAGFRRVTFVTLIYVLLSPKSSLAVLNLMKNPIFFYVEIYRGSHISEVMSERFVRIVRNRRIDFLQCKKYARRLCL